MNWLDKLERKFGKFAIKNLMIYIVGLTGIVYVLDFVSNDGRLINLFSLDRSLIFQGQIWRLITFVIIPPETSPIWIIFTLYLYYLVGSGLEQEWGSFKFNFYYFAGMLGTIISSLITGGSVTATYLNLSLFLAFAYVYPNFELLIFFVLPIKVKYLAILDWVFFMFSLVVSPIPIKVAIVFNIINFFLFFSRDILFNVKNKGRVQNNKRKFRTQIPSYITIHRCTVCGKTEKDDPKLEFRYCSTCEGYYEYCMEHLKNHEHVKSSNNKE